jgi:hypothetical protein
MPSRKEQNQESKEHLFHKEVKNPYEYYSHPIVSKAIAQFCGAENLPLNFQLTNTENKLNDWLCEYLAITNVNIAEEKSGRAPARSIKNKFLTDVLNWQPTSEIFMSLWQKESINSQEKLLPSRSIFVIDSEYYHKEYPERFLVDQLGVFKLIEPAYQIITEKLRQYGFNYNTVMTGKGYHFFTQISNKSPILEKIIEIGQKVDPALKGLQEAIPNDSKRDRTVPLTTQQAHQGMGRLVHYFVSQVINEIRNSSQIPIEISDVGMEGLALDLTPNLVRAVDTGSIGVPGSIYLKPHVKPDIYNQNGILDRTRILTRIYRESHGQHIENLEQLILTRQNFNLAINNLKHTNSQIPESELGFAKLIRDYLNSELYQFHQALDENQGNHWTDWPNTYRNYEGIAGNDPTLQRILAPDSHDLLEPGSLNYTLHNLFEKWGGDNDLSVAGHVRTFLRSAYEDPRFNWGKRFTRHYSAAQHAEGWATIILGQRFDKK